MEAAPLGRYRASADQNSALFYGNKGRIVRNIFMNETHRPDFHMITYLQTTPDNARIGPYGHMVTDMDLLVIFEIQAYGRILAQLQTFADYDMRRDDISDHVADLDAGADLCSQHDLHVMLGYDFFIDGFADGFYQPNFGAMKSIGNPPPEKKVFLPAA